MEVVDVESKTEKIDKAVHMLKAIAHPLRLQIVELLTGNDELCVSDIHRQIGVEQAVASQQLKILKQNGVLNCERKGKHSFYHLAHPQIKDLISCIESCHSC
ncbi:MAG: metalloregulator ArsR/SmtB family transcription factor [Salibacter sp.]|jgi:DNA-binding transcriptional ArsR family regulator|uniref:ArsR/SmtB family transcription factor n=1 Tax=Salibacter sp. TaxID=2010995 RepID=UPI0028702B02|nr:metalloregulator ArsR/SmtB family transcription factor [Salibacter sp.]MDR9399281.1 metalloregulator ArsR/SmtB family transcription factor [Salibacter sp.]